MNKILVIEDNKDIRENTAELLELNGYCVQTAENGSAGFELAKKYVPDIILCDIMMPETDGRVFLRLAKGNMATHDIPVVFFSAGSSPDSSPEVQKELIDGINIYLKKPFLEKDLLQTVKTGLAIKTKHQSFDSVDN